MLNLFHNRQNDENSFLPTKELLSFPVMYLGMEFFG
jgi:hypothetical protein